MKSFLGLLIALSLGLGPSSVGADPPDAGEYERAENALRKELGSAKSTQARAVALSRLAWPDGPVDPAVQALARKVIVGYGERGLPAMRQALWSAPIERTADLVQAVIEAGTMRKTGLSQDYLLALDTALWVASPAARRLAIEEIGRRGYRISIPAVIDSAIEHPELTDVAVLTLGNLGDEIGRFFLADVFHEDRQGLRLAAAVSLARIGGRALDVLRDATRSADADLRVSAVRAILPVATPDDLSALYGYVADHPDDDAETVAAARRTAVRLEEILEAQRAADAASSESDF